MRPTVHLFDEGGLPATHSLLPVPRQQTPAASLYSQAGGTGPCCTQDVAAYHAHMTTSPHATPHNPASTHAVRPEPRDSAVAPAHCNWSCAPRLLSCAQSSGSHGPAQAGPACKASSHLELVKLVLGGLLGLASVQLLGVLRLLVHHAAVLLAADALGGEPGGAGGLVGGRKGGVLVIGWW